MNAKNDMLYKINIILGATPVYRVRPSYCFLSCQRVDQNRQNYLIKIFAFAMNLLSKNVFTGSV